MSQKSRSPLRRMMRTCRSKRAYHTVKELNAAIVSNSMNHDIDMTGYQCDVCGLFHMATVRAQSQFSNRFIGSV